MTNCLDGLYDEIRIAGRFDLKDEEASIGRGKVKEKHWINVPF